MRIDHRPVDVRVLQQQVRGKRTAQRVATHPMRQAKPLRRRRLFLQKPPDIRRLALSQRTHLRLRKTLCPSDIDRYVRFPPLPALAPNRHTPPEFLFFLPIDRGQYWTRRKHAYCTGQMQQCCIAAFLYTSCSLEKDDEATIKRHMMDQPYARLTHQMSLWRAYAPRIAFPLLVAATVSHLPGHERWATTLIVAAMVVVAWLPIHVLLKLFWCNIEAAKSTPNQASDATS